MSALNEAKQIIASALKISVDQINDDSTISSYGDFDSLSFENIVLETQNRIGKQIKAVQLLELRSVKDLADLIEKHKSGK